MPRNPNFVHIAPRLAPELVARLEDRQEREGLRSFTAAVRAELVERLAAGGPFGPILAPPTSAKRRELWLPRDLMEQVWDQAEAADASASNMLITILAAGADQPAASSTGSEAEVAARQGARGQQQPIAA